MWGLYLTFSVKFLLVSSYSYSSLKFSPTAIFLSNDLKN